ncbi:hypothetical protein L7F22_000170 [Adiantum nelumboides]|nr:hypothetical protein [Adiantum nelumboides]
MARDTRHTRHAVQSTNQPSSEQESSAAEEGDEEESAHSNHGATDMTSSDASDESYKIPSHMADPDSSSQSDSGPSGRPQVNPKINRKQAKQMLHHSINRPAKSKTGPSTVCVPLSTAAIFTHSVVTPSTTPLGVVSSSISVSVAPVADTIPVSTPPERPAAINVSTPPERLVNDFPPAVSHCHTCSSTPAVPAVSPRRTDHLPFATVGASFTYTDSTSLFRLSEENLRKSREALATIEQGTEQLAAIHQSHSATYAAMEGALRIAESAIADRDASLFAMRHALRDQSRVIADLRVQNEGLREALLLSQMGFQPPMSSGYGGYGGIGQGIQIQTPIGYTHPASSAHFMRPPTQTSVGYSQPQQYTYYSQGIHSSATLPNT